MTETQADPNATRDVYDAAAAVYDAQRTRAFFEAGWLRRFARALPEGGRVLDLGCGTGRPLAGWLIGEGFKVTGADFSPSMLELARERWPDGDWRLADMRSLDLGESFDGILGWDSFFHLTQDEQRACLPRLAEHLLPSGALMVTVGPEAGEVTGHVDGRPVYHASLSPADYAAVLEDCGMRMTGFLAEDPECGGHTVLMARKLG